MTSDREPPDNVVSISSRVRRKGAPRGDLFALLSRLDELEEMLETLDELGIQTRDELEALIADLEEEAARNDPGDRPTR